MAMQETAAVARRIVQDALRCGGAGARGPWLVLLEGDREAGQAPLREGLTIGRSRRAALRLDLPEVSRLHARVVEGPAGLAIVDTGSKNGVAVNGRLAGEPVRLRDGDLIALGTATLRVEGLQTASAPSPGGAAPPGAGDDAGRATPTRLPAAIAAAALLLAGMGALVAALA